MQQGRGGMGSHKHGIHGRGGTPPGLKQRLAREHNEWYEEKQEEQEGHKQTMYVSIQDLMKNHKKRQP